MNKKTSMTAVLSLSLVIVFMSINFAALAEGSSKISLVFSPDSPALNWQPCPDFLPCQFAVLHGELGDNNMDIFLKFPSKAKVPFHTHTSTEHMILIAGEFHTTYEGQDRVVLRAGDYAYGPAKLPHDGFCASKVECVMFVAYDTPLDAIPYEAN